MTTGRSAFTPFLVLFAAILLGGWFLQEGVERESNVYVQARVFQEVVDRVSGEFVDDIDPDSLYESAIEGLIEGLGDPNSSFIPARAYEDFEIRTTTGEYGGVGLEVIERDGHVTVVGPIPGTPGARAGIRPGDWFVEIEGQDARDWPVDRAVEVLRGEPGTTVEVQMGRPGVEEPIPFTLERAIIQLRAVPFATMLDESVAYVPLQVFRGTASSEVRGAVDSLVAEGATTLVLDLRGNPGGLLEEGIAVSELFLAAGDAIVETRGRGRGQSRELRSGGTGAYAELPVVVLVDGTSASASEIVAGALQDHDRALVVGVPTYGKGSVQTLFQLSGGNVLRLTTARWYTPVGRSIDLVRDEPISAAHGSLTLSGGMLPPDAGGGERPTYESMGGRTLYGGGGIVPDVTVVPDTLTASEARAVRALFGQGGVLNAALFAFAVQYVQEHGELEPGFTLEPDAMSRFEAFAAERGVEIDAETFEGARRFLQFQLEREIALQAMGDLGQFRHMQRYDRQLEAALERASNANTTAELLEQAGVGVPEGGSPASAGLARR